MEKKATEKEERTALRAEKKKNKGLVNEDAEGDALVTDLPPLQADDDAGKKKKKKRSSATIADDGDAAAPVAKKSKQNKHASK
jgi:hypothetical protein